MSEIEVSVGLVLSETLREESVLGQSPWLDADGCFLPVSSQGLLLCTCRQEESSEVSSSSYRDTSCTGLGPHP